MNVSLPGSSFSATVPTLMPVPDDVASSGFAASMPSGKNSTLTLDGAGEQSKKMRLPCPSVGAVGRGVAVAGGDGVAATAAVVMAGLAAEVAVLGAARTPCSFGEGKAGAVAVMAGTDRLGAVGAGAAVGSGSDAGARVAVGTGGDVGCGTAVGSGGDVGSGVTVGSGGEVGTDGEVGSGVGRGAEVGSGVEVGAEVEVGRGVGVDVGALVAVGSGVGVGIGCDVAVAVGGGELKVK